MCGNCQGLGVVSEPDVNKEQPRAGALPILQKPTRTKGLKKINGDEAETSAEEGS